MITIFDFSFTYLDVAIVFIMIVSVIIGYVKGFFKTIVNFARYSVGLFLCFYISSNLSPVMYDKYVRQYALESISNKINELGVDTFMSDFQQTINSLPKFIVNSLDLSVLSFNSDNIAEVLLVNIVEPLAISLLKIVLFLAVLIVFFVSTGLIIHVASRASKRRDEKRGHMSGLKKTDKLIGAFLGLANCLVIILATASIATFIIEQGYGSDELLQQIQNSSLISFINEVNPFNAITEGLI